jgi:ABC-type bacteriocin/lantibiotic exporter with double-glycine peptidase domain
MLGWSAFGGVIVCVLLIPCNTLVVMMNKKWQIRQMAFKDKRLKLTSEVLNGIKVVKLYGWEQAMMNEINELRKNEINLIRKEKLTQSIVDCANASSPFIVAAVTFALFTLTGGILTPQVAFVSIAIFIQLRASFFMIADLIGETVQVGISLSFSKQNF